MSYQLVARNLVDAMSSSSTTKTRKNETTKNGVFLGDLPLARHFVLSRFRGQESLDLAM
jgi:hypothetical protein